jgi:hypothetical protein
MHAIGGTVLQDAHAMIIVTEPTSMTLDEPRRRTFSVGDLDGPHLRDFLAAWEDDVRAADEQKQPARAVRSNVVFLRGPAQDCGCLDGAGLRPDWFLHDIGHADSDDEV